MGLSDLCSTSYIPAHDHSPRDSLRAPQALLLLSIFTVFTCLNFPLYFFPSFVVILSSILDYQLYEGRNHVNIAFCFIHARQMLHVSVIQNRDVLWF